MELKLALICDSANVSQEGKLNILGEFNTIWGQHAPIKWPMLTLVARFEAHAVEGSGHTLAIDITDADGHSILDRRIEAQLTFSQTAPGRPLRANILAGFRDLAFPKFGDYEFHMLVDGHSMGTVVIYIAQRQQPLQA